MLLHEKDIRFTLIYFEEEIIIHTYEGEFRNLMTLINEKIYVEDFGECKGIGRCGTCLVATNGFPANEINMDRNEKRTLEKCGIIGEEIRLSCQILINQNLHDSTITIMEDRWDVR